MAVKMQHKKRKINLYFENDEDDMPLANFTGDLHNDNPNCYDSLCIPENQTCDLCDEVSSTRYSSFIHNAKHIIIPLCKLTVYQCTECLHHFTSTKDLIIHQSRSHSLYDLIPGSDPDRNINNQDEKCKLDQRITVKQEIWKTTPSQEPTLKSEVIIEKQEKYKTPNQVQGVEFHRKEPLPNGNDVPGSSIKSRLLFEEDIIPVDSDKLLIDLTTDCHVNVELFPPIWEVYRKTTHYEELIKPGVFRCRKCIKMFPNRYEMIRHESQHIFIKNSQINLCNICNTYILGGNKQLKHHKLKSHTINFQESYEHHIKLQSDGVIRENTEIIHIENRPIICKQDGDVIHEQIGGDIYERIGGDIHVRIGGDIHKQIGGDVHAQIGGDIHRQIGGDIHKQDGRNVHKQNGGVEPYQTSVTTLHLCDLCLSFCKNRRGVYQCIGELNDVGKKFKCCECGFEFFSIKLVKRVIRHKSWKPKENKVRKKGLSNETRLKLISNRFKMMRN